MVRILWKRDHSSMQNFYSKTQSPPSTGLWLCERTDGVVSHFLSPSKSFKAAKGL